MPSSHSDRGALKFVHGIAPDSKNRPVHDFYRTPPIGTRSLINIESFNGKIWEPACGDGAISEVLIEAGYNVVSSDLIDRGYGDVGIDFLTAEVPSGVRNVITNPPFTLMLEFAEHALNVVDGKVALLGRLGWLEGTRRYRFFQRRPPSNVWVFSYRLNVSRNGVDFGDGGVGGMVPFAWYVWDQTYDGPTRLGWLAPPGA